MSSSQSASHDRLRVQEPVLGLVLPNRKPYTSGSNSPNWESHLFSTKQRHTSRVNQQMSANLTSSSLNIATGHQQNGVSRQCLQLFSSLNCLGNY